MGMEAQVIDLLIVLATCATVVLCATPMGKRVLRSVLRRFIMDEEFAAGRDALKARAEQLRLAGAVTEVPVQLDRADELAKLTHEQRVLQEKVKLEILQREFDLMKMRYDAKVADKDFTPLSGPAIVALNAPVAEAEYEVPVEPQAVDEFVNQLNYERAMRAAVISSRSNSYYRSPRP
jgi:hypothetical protein